MTDKVDLQIVVQEYLNNIDNFIIKTINQTDITTNFEKMRKYCLNNTTLIFDAIDYIFPHIKNENSNVKTFIDALTLGFVHNKEIITFLNEYKDKILILLDKDQIYKALYTLSMILLLDLHRYHGIYSIDNAINGDLKDLIIKEYLYRHKEN